MPATLAAAKINLCLFVGPTRADGRHELVTVFEPLRLGDRVSLEDERGGGDRDVVVCPAVEGPNLAADALAAFRARTGWDGPPQRVAIDKRVPVAAGMGGGSSDAAAVLRLMAERAALGAGAEALLLDIAAGLGADVPAAVLGQRALGTGAGERVRRVQGPSEPYGVLVLPSAERLSTPAVYTEADRLGLARDAAGLEAARAEVDEALRRGEDPPPANDLEPAARSLCPAVGEALETARAVGARRALVAGSGPTVVGLFETPDEAAGAAERLAGRRPAPIATAPLLPGASATMGPDHP